MHFVSGSIMFSVDDVEAFLGDENVGPALSLAIASMVGVDASAVSVSLSPSRRLRERRLTSGSIALSYEIRAESAVRSLEISSLLAVVTREDLLGAMNDALDSADVVVDIREVAATEAPFPGSRTSAFEPAASSTSPAFVYYVSGSVIFSVTDAALLQSNSNADAAMSRALASLASVDASAVAVELQAAGSVTLNYEIRAASADCAAEIAGALAGLSADELARAMTTELVAAELDTEVRNIFGTLTPTEGSRIRAPASTTTLGLTVYEVEGSAFFFGDDLLSIESQSASLVEAFIALAIAELLAVDSRQIVIEGVSYAGLAVRLRRLQESSGTMRVDFRVVNLQVLAYVAVVEQLAEPEDTAIRLADILAQPDSLGLSGLEISFDDVSCPCGTRAGRAVACDLDSCSPCEANQVGGARGFCSVCPDGQMPGMDANGTSLADACVPCPPSTAGRNGVCARCALSQEPNVGRTVCEEVGDGGDTVAAAAAGSVAVGFVGAAVAVRCIVVRRRKRLAAKSFKNASGLFDAENPPSPATPHDPKSEGVSNLNLGPEGEELRTEGAARSSDDPWQHVFPDKVEPIPANPAEEHSNPAAEHPNPAAEFEVEESISEGSGGSSQGEAGLDASPSPCNMIETGGLQSPQFEAARPRVGLEAASEDYVWEEPPPPPTPPLDEDTGPPPHPRVSFSLTEDKIDHAGSDESEQAEVPPVPMSPHTAALSAAVEQLGKGIGRAGLSSIPESPSEGGSGKSPSRPGSPEQENRLLSVPPLRLAPIPAGRQALVESDGIDMEVPPDGGPDASFLNFLNRDQEAVASHSSILRRAGRPVLAARPQIFPDEVSNTSSSGEESLTRADMRRAISHTDLDHTGRHSQQSESGFSDFSMVSGGVSPRSDWGGQSDVWSRTINRKLDRRESEHVEAAQRIMDPTRSTVGFSSTINRGLPGREQRAIDVHRHAVDGATRSTAGWSSTINRRAASTEHRAARGHAGIMRRAGAALAPGPPSKSHASVMRRAGAAPPLPPDVSEVPRSPGGDDSPRSGPSIPDDPMLDSSPGEGPPGPPTDARSDFGFAPPPRASGSADSPLDEI